MINTKMRLKIFNEGLDIDVFMTDKNIGWGIICNWSVQKILAKIDIFCHRKKNTDE